MARVGERYASQPRYWSSRHDGTGASSKECAAAFRIRVPELARVLEPVHVEQALLHAMVEPRAAEDELASEQMRDSPSTSAKIRSQRRG